MMPPAFVRVRLLTGCQILLGRALDQQFLFATAATAFQRPIRAMLDQRLQDILSDLRRMVAAAGPPSESPQAALQQVLDTALQAEGIAAGIVWLADDHGRLRVLCERGLQELVPGGRLVVGPQHQQRLTAALREGQVACVALGDGEVPPGAAWVVALGPVFRNTEPAGVLELFAPGDSEEDRAQALKFLEELTAIAGECLSHQSAPEDDSTVFWERFERFALNLQRSLDVNEVAAVAVNDGRVLLGCDRLSVALQYGNRTVVRAISGQDKVQQRSNLVRAMTRLAHEAMAAREAVTYRGVLEEFAPQLQQPLSEYVVEGRSRMVMVVPLGAPPPLVDPKQELTAAARAKPTRLIGCLIVEQATETRPRTTITRRIDLVTDHTAVALANARRHSELFLLPVWRQLGRGVAWFHGRRRWIAAAVLAGLAAVSAGLAMVPWEYRVEGQGKAFPVIQREVFAPWDGDVVDVYVESGARVAAGTPLLLIDSDDLDAETIAARNAVREKEKLADALRVQFQAALEKADREEQVRVQGELAKARIELNSAEEKARVFDERMTKLTVCAPIDGVVATYQLKQNLLGRPVRRGEVLVEVMDDNGPWRLELELPEHRMGHVLRALEASRSGSLVSGSLAVEYVPATAVERTLRATLTTVATRSGETEERGTVVEVFADIDADDLPGRRIGADVTAKVHCGKRSLGYVLLGDVIEFVQRHVWW